LSGEFFQRCLFAAVDAIFGVIVTKCNEPVKMRANFNCGLTIIIVTLFSLCRLQIAVCQLRSGTVDKMAGIFAKRTWQP